MAFWRRAMSLLLCVTAWRAISRESLDCSDGELRPAPEREPPLRLRQAPAQLAYESWHCSSALSARRTGAGARWRSGRTITRVSTFIAETTDLLRRTPEVLRTLLAGIPESWTDTTDVPEDGWRPRDVVGHLITGELTDWIERTQRILEHGTAVPFDRFDRFAHEGRDADATLDDLIEHFARLRSENLARLTELATEEDLDRRGLHPTLGEVTLRELLATWAVHDLDHVSQVFAAMAGSHDAEVGPWKAYLGILLRREDPAAVAG